MGLQRHWGHAIFVFVKDHFGYLESFLDNPGMPVMFKHAKGPDFVSRLSGQLLNADIAESQGWSRENSPRLEEGTRWLLGEDEEREGRRGKGEEKGGKEEVGEKAL